jgi:hypothetical protein
MRLDVMTGNETEERSGIERRSIVAACVAGVCNVLSILIASFDFFRHEIVLDQLSMKIVWFLVLLAPMVVAIIGRHIAVVTYPYASLLFLILAGQLAGSAASTFIASWGWALLGMLSAFFLLMLTAKYLEAVFTSAWRRRYGESAED